GVEGIPTASRSGHEGNLRGVIRLEVGLRFPTLTHECSGTSARYGPPKAHHAGGRRGKKRPTGATGGGGPQAPDPCAARQAIMIAWPGWRMRHPAEPAHARAPSKQSSVLGKAQ